MTSRLRDLWLLGSHRLLCGNALRAEDYQAVLGGDLAQMCVTDPPYNVAIDGLVCGSGKVKHKAFLFAAGEMSPAQFTTFLGPPLPKSRTGGRPWRGSGRLRATDGDAGGQGRRQATFLDSGRPWLSEYV